MTQHNNRIDLLVLFCLAALWGSSFGAIKVALKGVSPLSVMSFRVLLACLTLLIVVKIRKSVYPKDWDTWIKIGMMGLLGTVMPFFMIAWGQLEVDSSLAAILMAVNPLFALGLGHFFSENEKFNLRKLFAMLIGISGVMLVFGENAFNTLGENITAQLAIIIGGIGYTISGVIAVRVKNISADSLSSSIFLVSSIMVLPLWFGFDSPLTQHYSMQVLIALAYLGVVTTGIAFLLRYYLIMRNGAVFFSYVAYLIPMFGILYGYLFFDEQIALSSIVAVFMILFGIYLGRKASST